MPADSAATGSEMSTAVVLLMVVVGAIALLALAWWASGRSRGTVHNALAAGERTEADARAMKQHRPNSSAPLGPL
jgi:hypothetical protein